MKFKSILDKITEDVFTATSLDAGRKTIENLLQGSNIKDRDKMLKELKQQKSLSSLQRYFANALLKFEGLGVG